MKLVPKEYIVGAHILGTERATSTVRNLPKLPVDESTPKKRPPALLPFWNAASHAGTYGAEAAKAAPRKC